MTQDQLNAWQQELDYHLARHKEFQGKIDEGKRELARQQHEAAGNRVYRLFLTSPVYQWPPYPATQESVRRLQAFPGFDSEFRAICRDADIGRSRATQLMWYLKRQKDWEFFLSVDWDIEFRAEDVYRMCQRMEQFNVGCLGGPYPFKTDDGEKASKIVMRGIDGVGPDEHHIVRCKYVAGGFTMVRDATIRKLMESYKHLRYRCNPDLDKEQSVSAMLWQNILLPRPDWPKFDDGEEASEYLSEDYSFCQRILDIGETVAMDLTVQLKHHDGNKVFVLPTNNPEEKKDGSGDQDRSAAPCG